MTNITDNAKDIAEVMGINEIKYEDIKGLIKTRLYGKDKEADVFKSAEEYGFEDLILVPYIEYGITEDGVLESIRINKDILVVLGKTADEVIEQGITNLDYQIHGLGELLGFDDTPMILVTNSVFNCGASSIIKAKTELETKFPNGYVVLPSSIHEVLVIPIGIDSTESLVNLVTTINAIAVNEKDKLSDNAYTFIKEV